MKITKELQEVMAVVLIDEQLGDLVDDWGITKYLPEELQEKNKEFFLCLVQYKELLNQWSEKNLQHEEQDGDKEEENKATH